VGLSGGSTTTQLARQLRAMEDVTIATNALNIALELKTQSSTRVMVMGGILNQDSYDLVGDLSVLGYQRVHLDIAFQGATGIDPKFGFTVADEPDAVVARALQAASDRLFVVADHSKIGKATFARFCELHEVDGLITDSGLDGTARQELEDLGLPVHVAH
jgi:DeoR family transcriptional regulator of aga operon